MSWTQATYLPLMYINTPLDTHWVFRALPLGLSVALYFFGFWAFHASTSRIQRVWAIPSSEGLKLKIEGRKWIPFLTKTITVPAEDVQTQSTLNEIQLIPKRPQMPIKEVEWFARPFVRFGQWCGRVFEDMKAVLFRSAFVHWYVSGRGWRNAVWKIDVRGMARGGGKGIDAIVHKKMLK